MALTRVNNQALTNVTSAGLPTLASSNMPTGSVIAAEYARKTDHQTFTSTTFADVTGLTVTMTPASTGSKFLVTASVHYSTYHWAAGGAYFGVYANSTLIAGSSSQVWMVDFGASSSTASYENRQYFAQRLYSPASTSAQVFKVQISNGSSGYDGYVNRSYQSSSGQGSDGECYLSVLEIAG